MLRLSRRRGEDGEDYLRGHANGGPRQSATTEYFVSLGVSGVLLGCRWGAAVVLLGRCCVLLCLVGSRYLLCVEEHSKMMFKQVILIVLYEYYTISGSTSAACPASRSIQK